MDPRFRAARTALTAWLDARAPRERRLLAAGGALALAAFGYTVLWEPAQTSRARIAARLPELRMQLADVEAQLGDVRRLRAAAAIRAPAGAALRDALAASLASAGIAGARVAVLGGGIQVEAKGVPFAAWMDWLERARREQRVRVTAAHAGNDGKSGIATVSATLQPADAP
ncbi:type II secretion system protein GspM [Burkholderia anthina]|uniref:type II secretion system protein GspM n=1 Tax=Burkholderia anthina TaxID=179879 RepID=UPI00158A5347